MERNSDGGIGGRAGFFPRSDQTAAVRAFLAVELPTEVKTQLGEPLRKLQSDCRSAGVVARWSRPESWHLTLKFLGVVEPEALDPILRVLPDVVAGHHVFTVQLMGFGLFPSPERPRVVWIGMEENEGKAAFVGLALDIETALVPLGWPADTRPVTPHLTVARMTAPRGVPYIMERFEQAKHERWAAVDVRRIDLVESRLRPEGPIYRVLAVFPLAH